jgi:hypothetical protein
MKHAEGWTDMTLCFLCFMLSMQKCINVFCCQVEENRKYRLHEQWHYLPTVIAVDHIRKRELYYRGYLCRGRYILIPSTYKPEETGGHMVRMFSGSDINLR